MPIRFVTLSGPPGCGKTTIMRLLLGSEDPRLVPVKSTSTRSPRASDVPGEYEHVSPEEFATCKAAGEFLWDVGVSGNFYGTRKSEVNNLISPGPLGVMILVPSVLPILKGYLRERSRIVFTLSVFIQGVPEQVLREGMIGRGDSEETIESRLAEAREWEARALSSRSFNTFLSNRDEQVPGNTAANRILDYLRDGDFN